MARLAGQVAIITGAGSGIGRATALLFAAEGAKIVHCDLSPEATAETQRMLQQHNAEMQWHISPGIGHGIDPEGLRHGGEFLARNFKG